LQQEEPNVFDSFVQLYVDMVVLPDRESELLSIFKNTFTPAISKQPGFVSVRLLKLRTAIVGEAPGDAPIRLVITFQTEEQRLAWVATDVHQEVWPRIANTLDRFKAYLYDGQD
jgi:heme-degrading monooxygenase HmoA